MGAESFLGLGSLLVLKGGALWGCADKEGARERGGRGITGEEM